MKRIVLFLCIVFSGLSAYADENVLQTIEIEPVKDTYNIVLVSDKAVDVKKTVQDNNKINLILKDIRASKTLNTVYNNVSNVDTVMVEPQGNGINIFFQAENAANATVTFDALTPAAPIAPVAAQKKIKLSNPIESYAPIYNEDFEATKTSKLFNKLKSNASVAEFKDTLEESGANDTANKLISYGLVGLLVFSVARLFKRREPEMKIGLAQQTPIQQTGFGSFPAQQDYMSSMTSKPFTTVNYGLNAYKNENKNPYETSPMTFHNPRLQAMAQQRAQQTVTNTVPQTQQASSVATKPIQSKMTTPVNTSPVNQSNPNVDNLKFLESMTAIYEKSGRHDLARGLQESLSKNNLK